jgi:hypothetical protein
MRCNLVGLLGTCSPIQSGTDPDGECPGPKNCDGKGGCI